MDEILRQLAERLGIQPDQAAMGAGALLSFIREHASQVDFQQLLNAVPEASAWLGKAPQGVGGASGGGLLGNAAGVLGGFAGSAGGLLSALAQSGLGPEAVPRFVPELLGLLKERADPELVQRLVGSVPFLKEILGGLQIPGGLGKIFG
jgi:hypothetical protein